MGRTICILTLALAFMASGSRASTSPDTTLLFDDFRPRPEGLITNQYAFEHPDDPAARRDPVWELTSGSFFERHVSGFSGAPDHIIPNALSTNGNNSAVFRARTHRADFGDVVVSFDLQTVAFAKSSGLPAKPGDGVGVWLHYVSEDEVYWLEVNRRDNTVVFEKTMPGGSAQGRAYEWAPVPYAARINTPVHVEASIQTQRDSSVILRLTMDGKVLLRVRDDGRIGSAPIPGKGRVGLRGDNCEFYVRNFKVTANPAP